MDNRDIYQDEFWCLDDEHQNADVNFFDDGEHEECFKHHYRCVICNKIKQIG